MARRMDRKVIKLEAAYGSERQTIYVKRNQDLIVRDLMEEVQQVFKIPLDEQVIFHKGTNLCDFINQTLENLGIENNHQIRVTRDPELPQRSPRNRQLFQSNNFNNNNNISTNSSSNLNMMRPQNNSENFLNSTNSTNASNNNKGLDPVSYLKEIAPQRVPDPTPYQVKIYK